VLANGEILNLMDCVLRKNNTGYDMKQLFIGAEGTLGIITKVCVHTPKRPSSTHVALLGVRNFTEVRKTFQSAREHLGEILSAVEFMDSGAFESGSGGSKNDILDSNHEFYVLLETSGSCESHDREKLESFLEQWMESCKDGNGVLAQDESQLRKIWNIRENVGPSCSQQGLVYKYDISLPLAKMYDVVEIVRDRLLTKKKTSATRVVGYGHLGDSNLHLNVVVPDHDDQVLNILEPFVFDWTTENSGSISAEHGVGQCKNEYLDKTKPLSVLNSMHALKNMFDPNGILNPYKVLVRRA